MKSNAEWKEWGAIDPLYAVTSWKGKEKTGASPWTDEEFYSLGENDWSDFLQHWESYGVKKQHCLEIGCGAGRITKHISSYFDKVTAVDVSTDQISYAKSKLSARNIDFQVTDGVKIPLPDNTSSACFSSHVFQHFDSYNDALDVFQEIYRTLSEGGSACIHLPIFSLPHYPVTPIVQQLLNLSKGLGTIRANINRLRKKLIMRGLWYEQNQLLIDMSSMGFSDIETHGFFMKNNSAWHEVIMARK